MTGLRWKGWRRGMMGGEGYGRGVIGEFFSCAIFCGILFVDGRRSLADEPDDPAPASSRKGKAQKTTAASVEPRESARLKESSKPARKAAAEKEANLQKELKEMKKRCKALEKQAKVQRQNEDGLSLCISLPTFSCSRGPDDVQMDSEEETSRPSELFTSSISVKPAVMARKPPQLDLSRPPARSVKAVAPTPMRRIDILSVINNTVLEDNTPASNAAPLPALEDEEEEAASDELEATAQGASASPESANDNHVQVPRPQGAVPSARIASRSAPTPRPSSAMISVPIQPQYKAGVSLKERPKLGHYDGITLSIAQAAENEYEVLCLAKTAFPSTASRASMARNVWDGRFKSTPTIYVSAIVISRDVKTVRFPSPGSPTQAPGPALIGLRGRDAPRAWPPRRGNVARARPGASGTCRVLPPSPPRVVASAKCSTRQTYSDASTRCPIRCRPRRRGQKTLKTSEYDRRGWVAPFTLHVPIPIHLSCGRGESPSRRFSASREMRHAHPGGQLGAPRTPPTAAGARSMPNGRLARVPRPSPNPSDPSFDGRGCGAEATSSYAPFSTTRGCSGGGTRRVPDASGGARVTFPRRDGHAQGASRPRSPIRARPGASGGLPGHGNRAIVKGGSRIRGLAITAVRKRVFSEYKFVESAIPDVIVANVKIVADLTVNFNYMYKDPTTREGCCIVNIMHLILKDILFGSGRTSIGVVYKKYFCPVPVPLLGLIFCMIKCCLDEWRTGKCIEKAFSEVAVVDKTNDLAEHVKRVEDWAALDAELTTKFRTMWYNQACKLAGIPQDTDRVAIRGLSPDDQERARAELLQHLADMDEE
ncbi:hypothetical protein EV714DRAFT_239233 [Schizophyllum commune]